MSETSQLKESILKRLKALQARVEDLKELEDLRSRGLKIRYWRIAQKGQEMGAAAERLEDLAKSIEAGAPIDPETSEMLKQAATDVLDYHGFVRAIGETEGFGDGKQSVIRDIRGMLDGIDVSGLSGDISSVVERRTLNLFWRSLAQNLVFFVFGVLASFLISQLFQ
jgi:hypothetical protein